MRLTPPGDAASDAREQVLPDITGALADFVQGALRSLWSLECLLLLQRQPATLWNTGHLVGELRASTLVVEQILADFTALGVIEWIDARQFRFHPRDAALARLCHDLEAAYRQRPFAIRKLILSAPNERLRTFADAFRLKGR